MGGILLPSTAQSKPQGGEVVAVGEGRTIGKNKIDINVPVTASQPLFSLSVIRFYLDISHFLFLWCRPEHRLFTPNTQELRWSSTM